LQQSSRRRVEEVLWAKAGGSQHGVEAVHLVEPAVASEPGRGVGLELGVMVERVATQALDDCLGAVTAIDGSVKCGLGGALADLAGVEIPELIEQGGQDLTPPRLRGVWGVFLSFLVLFLRFFLRFGGSSFRYERK
jgi:hypothetical protein